MSTISLWVRLLFNRNKTMYEMSKAGVPAVWLTDTPDGGMRLNYCSPKRSFWGGSCPVERRGFEYMCYVCPGGSKEKKELWPATQEVAACL
jgi:hypothetical protein